MKTPPPSENPTPKWRQPEWWLSAPSLLWLGFFFLIPSLLIFLIAFRPSLPNGGIGPGWSLAAIRALWDPSYPPVIWRTLWLSGLTTALCLLLAVPVAYGLAQLEERWRRRVLLAIILPFWTNFVIRILAWQTLLHSEGPVKHSLVYLGLASENTTLLYHSWAVLAVLVYTYLPFAILPVYAAAEKFDFGLFDAALDLGASRFRAFRLIFLPGIRGGLLTALLIVFIPALGTYAITDLVGGTGTEMIGNIIARRVLSDRNYPLASALAAALSLAVLTPLLAAILLRKRISSSDPKEP